MQVLALHGLMRLSETIRKWETELKNLGSSPTLRFWLLCILRRQISHHFMDSILPGSSLPLSSAFVKIWRSWSLPRRFAAKPQLCPLCSSIDTMCKHLSEMDEVRLTYRCRTSIAWNAFALQESSRALSWWHSLSYCSSDVWTAVSL